MYTLYTKIKYILLVCCGTELSIGDEDGSDARRDRVSILRLGSFTKCTLRTGGKKCMKKLF